MPVDMILCRFGSDRREEKHRTKKKGVVLYEVD